MDGNIDKGTEGPILENKEEQKNIEEDQSGITRIEGF